MPNRAFEDKNMDKHYRTLMKNEALKSIKDYLNGAEENDLKYMRNIHSTMNTFSLASAEAKPFGFYDDLNISGTHVNKVLKNVGLSFIKRSKDLSDFWKYTVFYMIKSHGCK